MRAPNRFLRALTLRNALRMAWELLRYYTAGKGMLTMVGAEGCGFAKSSPAEPIPDVQFHFNPVRLSNHGLDLGFLIGEGYSLHVCDLRPKSRGEIRLASRDPLAKPAYSRITCPSRPTWNAWSRQ